MGALMDQYQRRGRAPGYMRRCTRIHIEKMQDITDCTADGVVAREDEKLYLADGKCMKAGIKFVIRGIGFWISMLDARQLRYNANIQYRLVDHVDCETQSRPVKVEHSVFFRVLLKRLAVYKCLVNHIGDQR